MSNHKSDNEIVVKMRKKLFCPYYDQERSYNKIDININFVEELVRDSGLAEVFYASLSFLFEMNEDDCSWLNNDYYGKPRNSLEVLFKKTLKVGYETEIENAVLEMYDKGNPNCLFLFQILKESGTMSVFFLEKISKEMEKKTRSSKQGDVKRKFIESYRSDIEDLISKSKAQTELSLFPQSLPQDKTPVKT